MQFKDHFSRLAAQYSTFRPHYPAALFDYLAGLCQQPRLAWDGACGTGQASVPLAQRFDAVIATDASAQQIAAATAHPRVTYRVARAEESGLEAGSVDLITVAQALHWLDYDAFYREANRVLRPAGILAVWSYGNFRIEGDEVNRLVQTFYSETVGPYWPPQRTLVEEGYQTLPFPFDELRAPQFEMQERWPLARLLGYLRSWSAVGRYVERHEEDPVTPLAEKLARCWGDEKYERQVVWPFALRVGRRPAGC